MVSIIACGKDMQNCRTLKEIKWLFYKAEPCNTGTRHPLVKEVASGVHYHDGVAVAGATAQGDPDSGGTDYIEGNGIDGEDDGVKLGAHEGSDEGEVLGLCVFRLDEMIAIKRFKEIGVTYVEEFLDDYAQKGIFGD